MTGRELIETAIRQYPRFSQQEGARSVTQVLQSMAEALAHGERIELRRVGVLGVKEVPARHRRTPRTGVPVLLAAQKRPFFTAAKAMHARLNGVTEATEASAPRSPERHGRG